MTPSDTPALPLRVAEPASEGLVSNDGAAALDGHRLLHAFSRIQSRAARARVISLAEAEAEPDRRASER